MEKNSEKKIWDSPVKESKSDPIYQGGYTDGYDAGEQYGYLSGWNESNDALITRVKEMLTSKLSGEHELSKWAEGELRKLRKDAGNDGGE